VLLALLLLAVPEVLTLQKFVELLALGDESHQLAEPPLSKTQRAVKQNVTC
jgi:hypothetical protein